MANLSSPLKLPTRHSFLRPDLLLASTATMMYNVHWFITIAGIQLVKLTYGEHLRPVQQTVNHKEVWCHEA